MNIRPMTLSDVTPVVDLLEKNFAEKSFFKGNNSIDRAGMTETLKRLCRRGEMRRITRRGSEIVAAESWIGENGGRVYGCLIVAALDNGSGPEREIYMVAVDPALRGNGAGSRLTDFFCAHYAERPLYAQCYPEQTQMAGMLQRRNFVQYGKTNGGNLLFRRLPELPPA